MEWGRWRQLAKQEAWFAIDFETTRLTQRQPRQPTEVALVEVLAGDILLRGQFDLRPERQMNAAIIEWLSQYLRDQRLCVAHNAAFDKAALHALYRSRQIVPPKLNWLCSQRLAEQVLGLYPSGLEPVCEALNIPLEHHNPGSDARAAARIVMHAMATAD